MAHRTFVQKTSGGAIYPESMRYAMDGSAAFFHFLSWMFQ
jgi:hypothetical protein